MFQQVIEYIDVEVTLPPPVKKQVWDEDTKSFVPMTLYRRIGIPNQEKLDWLYKTYGHQGIYKQGRFWDYSRAGNFTVMDEKVYTWYQMKWGNE
jgi:hypothetical protein